MSSTTAVGKSRSCSQCGVSWMHVSCQLVQSIEFSRQHRRERGAQAQKFHDVSTFGQLTSESRFRPGGAPFPYVEHTERGREETCDFQTKASELYWEVIVSQFFMRSFRRCLLLEDDSSSASPHASHLLAYLETTAVHIPTLLQNDGSLCETYGNNVRMNCAP